MSIRLSRFEQETIITFNAADDTANIYSCDPVWVRKIQKIKGSRKYSIGMEVDVPKKWIKITKPRELSPEQKAKIAKRLKTARENHSAQGSKKARTQK